MWRIIAIAGIVAGLLPYLVFLLYREMTSGERKDFAAIGLVACIVLAVGFAIWLTGWHVPPELRAVP
jgi:uncharacterized protein with PQ loop repeat